jgi:hypothetical protein
MFASWQPFARRQSFYAEDFPRDLSRGLSRHGPEESGRSEEAAFRSWIMSNFVHWLTVERSNRRSLQRKLSRFASLLIAWKNDKSP